MSPAPASAGWPQLGRLLGTGMPDWPPASAPERRFGPTWLEVECQDGGLTLTRLTCCPEGEQPWVLIRVSVRNSTDATVTGTLSEEWALRPRFAQLGTTGPERARTAAEWVSYQISAGAGVIRAAESFAGPPDAAVFGAPRTLVLEALGPARRAALAEMADGADHPVLSLAVPVRLAAGEQAEFWFRFGADDGAAIGDPGALLADSVQALRARLPVAAAPGRPEAGREIRWHAALLAGGACTDGVIGGHTLDQGSAYAFEMGFNGAARDPLQHALPLVYVEPDLALSVLRNTCAWATPSGDLPYALDGAKQPYHVPVRPVRPEPVGAVAGRGVRRGHRRPRRVRRAAPAIIRPPGEQRCRCASTCAGSSASSSTGSAAASAATCAS